MSEENKVVDEAVAEDTTPNNSVSPESEYIAESKKYRLRAQDAEKERDDLKAQIAEQDNLKLKANEEFKTLSEKQEAELSELRPYRDKFEAIEASTREELLLKLPEDKREEFKSESINTLRSVVGMVAAKSPEAPPARGSVGNQPPPKHWTEYKGDEAKKAYEATYNNIIKR